VSVFTGAPMPPCAMRFLFQNKPVSLRPRSSLHIADDAAFNCDLFQWGYPGFIALAPAAGAVTLARLAHSTT
jgi:hypothetical protein